jgi:UDPglucose 6-dehydrogenase/GDP-mannose 6-dehydrogenase
VKSTVVPGSTDLTVLPAVEEASGKRAGIDFGVGVNPEFLTEGRAVDDFMAPDRIVIGAGDARTSAMLTELYDSFPGVEVIITTTRTAEMIKYASNAMLATLISFSNELANLGAAIGGIDTVDVMRGLHASRYFTARDAKGDTTAEAASFLFAGCGFGGSCLPKDVTALAAHGRTHGVPMRVLESVLEVNAGQPATLVELTTRALGSLGGRTIAVLGLAFKPDTNDTRESPAFAVIRLLRAGGARVIAHDPVVTQAEVPDDILDGIELCTDLGSALRAADAAVIVTSWREYAALPSLLASIDPQPLVVDGRRMLDPDSVARYVGIGR